MSDEISLLPEKMRGKEEELKKMATAPQKEMPESVGMHIPKSEDEEIEVIEVDEGEIGEVLGGEPFLTRTLFKAQSLIDELRFKFFHPQAVEPPPKLPPQFFKPPPAKKVAPGLVPLAGTKPIIAPAVSEAKTPVVTPTAPIADVPIKAKARVIPSALAPRRIRVIKRVRKPVRVSFLDEESLRNQIDIPRRRFTLIIMVIVFVILLGGGFGLINWQGRRADSNLSEVQQQLAEVQAKINSRQESWNAFKDLEPRLKALSGLLDRHLSPSKVFDALELYTVPEVYYTNFTLSPDGKVSLMATAPNFETSARQIVAFEKSGLTAKVQAMGYQALYDSIDGRLASVSFQISLTLEPSVLKASQPLKQPLAER